MINIGGVIIYVSLLSSSVVDGGFEHGSGESQGRIQDFKLGVALNGGRREYFWGISCEKSYFFPILGGARSVVLNGIFTDGGKIHTVYEQITRRN